MPIAADAILIVRPSLIRFPPVRSRHIVYLLSVPLATTLWACGSGNSDKKEAEPEVTATSSPTCRQVPPPAAQNITWVPADLPLPDRTYAVQDLGTSNGVHHGVFATPIPIREFVRFAVTQWPTKGWRLGRGDSEANEAEDEFTRGKEGGSFKVRSDYCDQNWSELNLFYKPGLP
jgi:hypothetical protein